MIETIKNAWKVEDIRKKIMFVLLAMVVFRFGHSIYVPFIDTAALATQFSSYSGNLLGYFNVLSGGGLQTASVLALSIYPYINSSIIMQLLQIAIPALERMAKEGGEQGRKKIEMITRILALALSFVMGYGYYYMLTSMGVITNTGGWAAFVILMSFAGGAMFVMWLGEQITQKGIGNGTSMIIFIGIVSRMPSIIQTLIAGFSETLNAETGVMESPTMNWWKLIIFLGISLLIIVFVVYITNAERRIPVQYAKKVVGRKQYGGQSTHLPMKVNMSGVMPVIFASTIATVPATIAQFMTPAEGSFWYKMVNDWFSQSSPLYIIVYTLLIFVFAYFYSTIQFNPIEVANNLKKNGGFVPGFRPGKPTSDFISKVLNKITMMGAIFLALIAAAPLILSNIRGLGELAIGGTSVLIMCSVALETVKALEGQLLMRHYKGFLE